MRQSKYNFFFPVENGNYLAFNALKNGLAVLAGEMVKKIEALETGSTLAVNEQLLHELRRGGFVIEDDFDEYGLLTIRRHTAQYSTNHLDLTAAPTLNCNLRCKYCFENPTKSMMDGKIIKGLIDFIKNHVESGIKRLNICWYGGEPLLAYDVIEQIGKETIAMCDESSIRFSASIITNGTLLTRDMAEKLKQLRVGFAQVTIDGEGETHDRRRPYASGKGSFADILGNVKQSAGIIPISLRINIDRANVDQAAAFIEGVKREEWFAANLEKGLLSVYYGHVRKFSASCRCEKEEILKDGDFWSKEMELRKHLEKIGDQRNHYPDTASGCAATSIQSYVVGPQGDLYKCWNHLGIPGKSVGTIFAPIELSPLYIAYLTESFERDEECSECRFLPICMGGCVDIRVRAKRGEFDAKNCSQWKYYLEESLRAYYVSKLRETKQSPGSL